MEIWFPKVGDAWDRHDRLVQAIYFTTFAFGAWLYPVWPWRHRHAFWMSVSIFLLLHVLGMFVYTTQVGPILVWQWLVLLVLESYAIAFFVGWSTRQSGHHDKVGYPDGTRK